MGQIALCMSCSKKDIVLSNKYQQKHLSIKLKFSDQEGLQIERDSEKAIHKVTAQLTITVKCFEAFISQSTAER